MVLLRDDNLSSLQWKLGRVIAVHPGTDGLVRVVTVRTAQGEYVKISMLPFE